MSHRPFKVSMVCPTYNRPYYLSMAVRCFLQQTYEQKELIIVDDGQESILLPEFSQGSIQYIKLNDKTPTGTKRNIGAEAARGDIIANLDDDDFSASYRLTDQVLRLVKTGKAVTGYNQTVVYEEDTGLFYKNMGGPPYYASGTSQCYLKSWWDLHPFPDCTYGEDSVFARTARLADELAIAEVNKTMVARKHANNTDPVYTRRMRRLSPDDISVEFFSTLANNFIPAHWEEATTQFRSPVIDYKIDRLPEVQTR